MCVRTTFDAKNWKMQKPVGTFRIRIQIRPIFITTGSGSFSERHPFGLGHSGFGHIGLGLRSAGGYMHFAPVV